MHDNKQCVSIMSLLCQFRVRGFCMALGATLLVWLAFQDGIEAAQATDEDFLDAYKATILRDYEAAHNGLLPLAEAGHPAAAYHLSQLYWNGHGVKRNAATAIFWLKSAARGNYAQAQLELAIVYESGIGLTADYREAAKWMAKQPLPAFRMQNFSWGITTARARVLSRMTSKPTPGYGDRSNEVRATIISWTVCFTLAPLTNGLEASLETWSTHTSGLLWPPHTRVMLANSILRLAERWAPSVRGYRGARSTLQTD